MTDSRRDFVRKIATGAVYAAPVVKTLAAPGSLLGQHSSTSTKGGMGGGMVKTAVQGDLDLTTSTPSTNPAARPAPWEVKPGSGGG